MSLAQYPIVERAPNTGTDWHATEPWVQFGLRTIAYLCGGLLAASILFSISEPLVTNGTVIVEGELATVQPLEGGIVSKILVHNGDRVKAGDVLIQLDGTQIRNAMQAASSNLTELAIQEARLIAERDLKENFEAPSSVDLTSPDNVRILETQRALFEARRSAYLGQGAALKLRMTQTDSDLTAANSQLDVRNKELALNELDLSNVPLLDKSFTTTQRLGPLQRDNVRIRGDLIKLKAQIAKLKTARTEIDARLTQIDNDYKHQAAEELPKIQAALAEQTEQHKAISDKQIQTEIRAPISGIVDTIAVRTEGSTVQRGSTLLQIIPDDRKVLVDAKIEPRDIDGIQVGQIANLRFSSIEDHRTFRLDGIVRKVSDSAITGKEDKTYYATQIEVPPGEIVKRGASHRLVPGMQADVYLETQSHSALSYFLAPLTSMLP